MEIDKQLKKLCKDLSIEFNKYDQDWGIIHSNPKRVNEFIQYFMNRDLTKYMQYYVFELIVASYNDAILEGINNEILEKSFLLAVNKSYSNPNLSVIRDYWRRIYSDDEFPVGKLL